MAGTGWMIHRAGKWNGPYSEVQLRDYAARGVIEGNVLIKNEAGEVMPLNEAFGKDGSKTAPKPQAKGHTANEEAAWEAVLEAASKPQAATQPANPTNPVPVERKNYSPLVVKVPSYLALWNCGVILRIIGLLSAGIGGLLIVLSVGLMGNSEQQIRQIGESRAVYGVSMVVAGFVYFGVAEFVALAIDVAQHSHRQTAYLEKLANSQGYSFREPE